MYEDFNKKSLFSFFEFSYSFIALSFHILLIIYCFLIKKFKLKMLLQLTSISFFVTTIYFLFKTFNILNGCCLIEIIYTLEFGFTLSFSVFVLFWTLYFLKPNLLNNNEVNVGFGVAFGLHGANFLLILISFILFENEKALKEYNFLMKLICTFIISITYNSFGYVAYRLWQVEIYKIYKYEFSFSKFSIYSLLGTFIFSFSDIVYIYFNNIMV